MPEPVTFTRVYRDGHGPEYPADPVKVATVLRSMNEHADGWDPFKVKLRLSDGSTVVVGPKRRKAT